MAQVFRCLQDNRDTLKDVCRAALFEQVRGGSWGLGTGEKKAAGDELFDEKERKRETERDADIRIPNVTVERDGWA